MPSDGGPDHGGASELRELHGEHADAAGGAADQDGVAGPQVDRRQGGGGGAAGHRKRARHLVADAVRRMEERIGRRGGVLTTTKSATALAQRTAVDAVADGEARGAVADLVDNAGEVVSEAGRHRDAEPRRHLGPRGETPVHRIEPGGRHADADLARAGVRLRNVAQLQYLGTSERLIHDSSAHGGPPAGR